MKEKKASIGAVNNVYVATVVLYFLVQLILQLVYEIYDFQLTTVQSFIVAQGVLILPAIAYIAKNRINIKKFIRFKSLNVLTIVLLVIMTFFLIPVMNLISSISMLFSKNFIGGAVNELVSGKSFFIVLGTVAVIPAILEESVYRGVFYNEYRKVNTGKAILLSALFFGLLHMNFNQFSYAFIMGVVFCFIIEATDSILASMIVHFVINGWSTVLLKVRPYLTEVVEKMSETTGQGVDVSSLTTETISKEYLLQILPSMLVSALFSGVIAFILFYCIAKYNNRWDHIRELFRRKKEDKQQVDNVKFITLPLLGIMTLEIIFMIVREL